jgi:hypothetical protein
MTLRDILVRMATDADFAEAMRGDPGELVRRYGLTPEEAATLVAAPVDTSEARPGRLEERMSRSGGVFGSALAGAVEAFHAPVAHHGSGDDSGGHGDGGGHHGGDKSDHGSDKSDQGGDKSDRGGHKGDHGGDRSDRASEKPDRGSEKADHDNDRGQVKADRDSHRADHVGGKHEDGGKAGREVTGQQDHPRVTSAHEARDGRGGDDSDRPRITTRPTQPPVDPDAHEPDRLGPGTRSAGDGPEPTRTSIELSPADTDIDGIGVAGPHATSQVGPDGVARHVPTGEPDGSRPVAGTVSQVGPDGGVRHVPTGGPDGTVPPGTVTQMGPDGSVRHVPTGGPAEAQPPGTVTQIGPDGTVRHVPTGGPDGAVPPGTVTQIGPDGTVRHVPTDGPDRTVPPGTVSQIGPDGSIRHIPTEGTGRVPEPTDAATQSPAARVQDAIENRLIGEAQKQVDAGHAPRNYPDIVRHVIDAARQPDDPHPKQALVETLLSGAGLDPSHLTAAQSAEPGVAGHLASVPKETIAAAAATPVSTLGADVASHAPTQPPAPVSTGQPTTPAAPASASGTPTTTSPTAATASAPATPTSSVGTGHPTATGPGSATGAAGTSGSPAEQIDALEKQVLAHAQQQADDGLAPGNFPAHLQGQIDAAKQLATGPEQQQALIQALQSNISPAGDHPSPVTGPDTAGSTPAAVPAATGSPEASPSANASAQNPDGSAISPPADQPTGDQIGAPDGTDVAGVAAEPDEAPASTDPVTFRTVDQDPWHRTVTLSQGGQDWVFEGSTDHNNGELQVAMVNPDGTRALFDSPPRELENAWGTQYTTALGPPVHQPYTVTGAADGSSTWTVGEGTSTEHYQRPADGYLTKLDADGQPHRVITLQDQDADIDRTARQASSLADQLSGQSGTPYTLSASPDGHRELTVGEGASAQTYRLEQTLDRGGVVLRDTPTGPRIVATAPPPGPDPMGTGPTWTLTPDKPVTNPTVGSPPATGPEAAGSDPAGSQPPTGPDPAAGSGSPETPAPTPAAQWDVRPASDGAFDVVSGYHGARIAAEPGSQHALTTSHADGSTTFTFQQPDGKLESSVVSGQGTVLAHLTPEASNGRTYEVYGPGGQVVDAGSYGEQLTGITTHDDGSTSYTVLRNGLAESRVIQNGQLSITDVRPVTPAAAPPPGGIVDNPDGSHDVTVTRGGVPQTYHVQPGPGGNQISLVNPDGSRDPVQTGTGDLAGFLHTMPPGEGYHQAAEPTGVDHPADGIERYPDRQSIVHRSDGGEDAVVESEFGAPKEAGESRYEIARFDPAGGSPSDRYTVDTAASATPGLSTVTVTKHAPAGGLDEVWTYQRAGMPDLSTEQGVNDLIHVPTEPDPRPESPTSTGAGLSVLRAHGATGDEPIKMSNFSPASGMHLKDAGGDLKMSVVAPPGADSGVKDATGSGGSWGSPTGLGGGGSSGGTGGSWGSPTGLGGGGSSGGAAPEDGSMTVGGAIAAGATGAPVRAGIEAGADFLDEGVGAVHDGVEQIGDWLGL